MSAASPNNPDLKMMQAYFPDAVDIVFVNRTTWYERDSENHPNPYSSYMPPVTELTLNELEPETGIYAVMSPVTHRVYVFVDPSENF